MYRINVHDLENKESTLYLVSFLQDGTLKMSKENPALFQAKVEAERQITKFLLNHPRPKKYFEIEKVS